MALRRVILEMEKEMDHDPEKIEVEDILQLRAKLVSLGTVVYDHGPPLKALGKMNKPFFELQDTQEFLFCALANQQAADGSLTWLDQRISSLRSGVELHAQDKTNRRLNALTMLSAIFNPITLLAGIWGMNFVKMPELQFAYGYPIALTIMVATGILIFFYFKKTGWLD
jgi:magnesium transporter